LGHDVKTIIWDVDDVLSDLMRTWFNCWWLRSHPNCLIDYDQISENPPHELLGISKTDYLASLDEFRLSEVAREMAPVSEVLTWFHEHGDRFRHIALTGTPLRAAPASATWVIRHFGRWIRSFHLVPSLRQDEQIPVYDQSKVDFLRWWGKGDMLVDDSPLNVGVVKALGIQAVLLPRPWNQSRLTMVEALEVLTRSLE
jgi:FMN phosphatase YigB (HAD superfamily)